MKKVKEKLYVMFEPGTGKYIKSDAPVIITDKLAEAALFDDESNAENAAKAAGFGVLTLTVEHFDILNAKKEYEVPGYEQMELFGGS